MEQSINFQVLFSSRWHVGSGFGVPGQIDDQNVRDDQDFSRLPATHLRGLVRESCFQLAEYLNQPQVACEGQHIIRAGGAPSPAALSHHGEPPCLICRLFGSPLSKGSLWFSDARYNTEFRSAINHLSIGSKQDGYVSTHVALDRQTQRARANQLYNTEVVDPVLAYEAQINILQPILKEDLQWLIAALLFTRRVGGKRRRGLGSCQIKVTSLPDPYQAANLRAFVEQWADRVAEVTA